MLGSSRRAQKVLMWWNKVACRDPFGEERVHVVGRRHRAELDPLFGHALGQRHPDVGPHVADVVHEGHERIAPIASDHDVPRVRVPRDAVRRGVRLDHAAVVCASRRATPRRSARTAHPSRARPRSPARGRRRQGRSAARRRLRPRRAALRRRADDDVAGPVRELLPPVVVPDDVAIVHQHGGECTPALITRPGVPATTTRRCRGDGTSASPPRRAAPCRRRRW